MMSEESDPAKANAPKGDIRWMHRAAMGIVCALVVGIFTWSAEPGTVDLGSPDAADTYYNLLVQGFRAGQLNLKREAPPGLARLADPYDPAVNAAYIPPFTQGERYPIGDMSYYRGKLYLYFGVTPALVLFWPYAVLTGHYLPDKDAVVIFFALGFLVAAGLLHAIWRRYFPAASVWVATAGILALGLAAGILEVVSRCEVYEVAVGCGFAFTMLALAAIWRALHEPKRKGLWLLMASLAYGLAVGSRVSLLFGIVILLIPVAQAWRAAAEPGSRRRIGWLLMAAVVPAMLIGLGLMLYNALRFDSPFEFGWRYQLNGGYQPTTAHPFSLHYLWFNFRFYFLQPMQWGGDFPFLHAVPLSPVPAGYCGVGEPYSGILSNYPLVWLALAAPLAWRGRPAGEVSVLRWFVAAVFLLFVICALTLCLFFAATSRYELDFLPALMLLAFIGILSLETALVSSSVWRPVARWGWSLLLAYSMVFNLLASVKAHVAVNYLAGCIFFNQGRVDEAVERFQRALALQPESASFHFALGKALFQKGYNDEAIIQYKKALAIKPDFTEAAEAHNSCGYSLLQAGRVNEAIDHFQSALKIKPDFAAAHNNLGGCLLQIGRVDEAIAHFQSALEIQQNYSPYYNLGCAFRRKEMTAEAIACYQKAIELQPQFIPAKRNLAWMLATWPDPAVRNGGEAVALAEQANQFSNNKDPLVLRTLAAAYAEAGRFSEAVLTAKQALALAVAQANPGLTNVLPAEIGLYQTNSPCRSTNN